MSRNAIVIDTEGYSNKSSYNVGYTILDLDTLQIVKKDSMAIMPYLWENLQEKLRRSTEDKNDYLSNMCLGNIESILTDTGKKYKTIKTENGLFKHFLKVFKDYQIKDFYAFNVAFDKGAMKRSFTPYHYELLFKDMNFHDIQTAVFYTFCNNIEYVKFCLANGYLTSKGFCKCKAETFYRYITKKIDFNEEHTALADAEIETEMLIEALKINPNAPTKTSRPYLILNELYNKDNKDEVYNLISDYSFE